MPKKGTPISKAQVIRDYLAEHPGAPSRSIAEALTAQGIQATPGFVTTVRAMLESATPPLPEPVMPARHIPFEQGMLFYRLYAALCSYANDELNIVREKFSDLERFTSLSPEIRLTLRDAVYAQPELIDQFVAENPAGLTTEELAIVAGWRHAVIGEFYVVRYLKQYAVFLKAGAPVRAYGVQALASPFEEVVGPHLPVMVKAVLLPINGRIIYDGLLSTYRITFGPGIRRSLDADYKRAKEDYGLITSLPESSTPPVAKKKAVKRKPAAGSGPANVKDTLEIIVEMTDSFCGEYLNGEYAELCRKLAAALARKRPSPLLRGKPETWACGIVRTIGWVNFLDDPNQTPHLKLPLIDRAFGVAESTGQGKSMAVRKMFKIRNFDPKWTLPGRMDENPVVWMLEVNGFLMDVRNAPREVQEMAFKKGLIPYIPADRAEAGEDD